MRKYTIKKDKQAQFDLHRLFWRFCPRKVKPGSKLVFEGYIATKPYDIRPDVDQHDRHKLIGLPLRVFGKSNKNATIVTFQANPKDNTWDIAPYFNFDTKFKDGQEIKVKEGQLFEGTITFLTLNKVEIKIKAMNQESVMEYTWDNAQANYTGIILPWHGGKDNDGNGIGGVSPVDLEIKLNFKYNK